MDSYLLVIWQSDLTDEIKRIHFQAVVVSILLYGCTIWTLTKRMDRQLDTDYTRILQAILNKSCMQHHIKQQLYGHLPPITKTIQVRRIRHVGHCWRSKDSHWPLHMDEQRQDDQLEQLCADTGCSLEDLPEAMNDREGWRERLSALVAWHDDDDDDDIYKHTDIIVR